MWVPGADGTPPGLDPRFEELRRNLTTLRERLAEFDAHDGTRLAREGDRLSGNSRTEWQDQEDLVERAHHICERARLRLAELDPSQPWTPRLSRTLSEVRQAKDDMQHAIHVAARLAVVRTDYVHRLRVVKANATRVGETAMIARADQLIDLGLFRPLEQGETEVEELERDGFEGGVRAALDLLARLQAARGTVDKAAIRIAGFTPGPLPDLDELASWLERIRRAVAEGDTSESSSGEQLGRWQERAEEIGKPILAAEAEASSLLHIRGRLRGQLGSLGEKAGELGVRERPDVDLLISQIREGLWTAPSDLAVAEKQLLTLGNLLNEQRGGGGR
jgi:predicted nuclease with TOPRIM domain